MPVEFKVKDNKLIAEIVLATKEETAARIAAGKTSDNGNISLASGRANILIDGAIVTAQVTVFAKADSFTK